MWNERIISLAPKVLPDIRLFTIAAREDIVLKARAGGLPWWSTDAEQAEEEIQENPQLQQELLAYTDAAGVGKESVRTILDTFI
ncbi:hypothetical protein [Paenibacillus donghaensis]|uniref:Uncharacterized protein n=1 Tax=Paenibacillus donghaensis TaxID=414771 RepID=A0A2Z2KM97_9BACL|nr:hypothetical protein [Paenibacillus donghaensis]ASA21181.1 hypothetical protein B9T62_10510 [Paenibacillus donghaensis]